MAGEVQNQTWPLPKFYFLVDFGGDLAGAPIPFQEVSGLETEAPPIEYRHGDSPAFSRIRMPGLAKVGNVTLKRGIFAPDSGFWDWFQMVSMNNVQRRTVTISLLSERGMAKMVWTLTNAIPVKVSGTDLKSDNNEVAVELIELAYERLAIELM